MTMFDPQSRPPRSFFLHALVISACLVVLLAGIMAAKAMVAPMLLSVFFAVIMIPPLRWLKRKGFSETLALLILSAVIFLGGLGMIGIVGSSLNQFIGKLGHYQEKLTEGLKEANIWLDNLADRFEFAFPSDGPKPEAEKNSTTDAPKKQDAAPADAVVEYDVDTDSPESIWTADTTDLRTDTQTDPDLGDADSTNGAAKGLNGGASSYALVNLVNPKLIGNATIYLARETASQMSVLLVVMVTVIFILLEASRFPDKIKAAFGDRLEMSQQLEEITASIWNYTVIKGWISLATGVATWIFLWFCGVEYAMLWGLFAFFFNFIPNVGPIISSLPPILLAWIDIGLGSAILVTGGLIFINFAIGYGIEPKYLGEGLGISSLVVLLSLIFWGWALGPVGMFLSAPLTMIFKIVLQTNEQTRWIAILLGPAAPHVEQSHATPGGGKTGTKPS